MMEDGRSKEEEAAGSENESLGNPQMKRQRLHFPSDHCVFTAPLKRTDEVRPTMKRSAATSVLKKATIGIVDCYKSCNPELKVVEGIPQRVLTNPSDAYSNNGMDNEDGNLICRVHDVLTASKQLSFTVLDLLGTGTFGQVFRCQRSDTKEIVAVKVIKNKPAYHAQGLIEVKIAKLLNQSVDPNNEKHIVRLLESFHCHNHICLVFELLSMSLLDVLTQNQFRGLPLAVVQRFTKQVLTSLVALQNANVIHCDLKPENILLVPSGAASTQKVVTNSDGKPSSVSAQDDSARASGSVMDSSAAPRIQKKQAQSSSSDIKVIDFGSACFEGKTAYSYIQSRFYRSPEVLLGLPYNGSIDMWSLACVCAEMYLGLPLFPGVSQHNQLARIIEMMGMPPKFMIEKGSNGNAFFTKENSGGAAVETVTNSAGHRMSSTEYRFKSAEEYATENGTKAPVLRKYLRYNRLDDVIMKCPMPQKIKLSPDQKSVEVARRYCFLDFLSGIFRINPFERWSAQQAFAHPFIQNTPFTGPFVPPLDLKVNERKLHFMVVAKVDNEFMQMNANRHVNVLEGQASASQQEAKANRRGSEPVMKVTTDTLSMGSSRSIAAASDSKPQLRRGDPVHIRPNKSSDSLSDNADSESTSSSAKPSRSVPNPREHSNIQYSKNITRSRMKGSDQPHRRHSGSSSANTTPSKRIDGMMGGQMSGSYGGTANSFSQMSIAQQFMQQQLHFAQQQQHNQAQGMSLQQMSPQTSMMMPNYMPYTSAGPSQSMSASIYGNSNLGMGAGSIGSSYGAYAVGSMQDGGGVIMPDFGLALRRPDVDEQRLMMSGNGTALQQRQYEQFMNMMNNSSMNSSGVQYGSLGSVMSGSAVMYGYPNHPNTGSYGSNAVYSSNMQSNDQQHGNFSASSMPPPIPVGSYDSERMHMPPHLYQQYLQQQQNQQMQIYQQVQQQQYMNHMIQQAQQQQYQPSSVQNSFTGASSLGDTLRANPAPNVATESSNAAGYQGNPVPLSQNQKNAEGNGSRPQGQRLRGKNELSNTSQSFIGKGNDADADSDPSSGGRSSDGVSSPEDDELRSGSHGNEAHSRKKGKAGEKSQVSHVADALNDWDPFFGGDDLEMEK